MINISNFTYHATEGIIDLENNFISAKGKL